MSKISEEFIDDLNELSDESSSEAREAEMKDTILQEDYKMEDNFIKPLKFDNLLDVCTLTSSNQYKCILKRVDLALSGSNHITETSTPSLWTGPLEDDPSYRLLVECNHMAADIEYEIALAHNFNRDHYRSRFPELESLVHHPLDYARVIQAIGSQHDIMQVDLDDILPPSNVMVVTVTASTTSGQPLPNDLLNDVLEGCDMVLKLENDKAKILSLVEKKMNDISPNLSIVLGPTIAAKLMGVAGGLIPLSKTPATNIQGLGAKRKNLTGFSTSTVQLHQGFAFNCEIVQGTPPAWRKKALNLVSAKCAILARVDAYGQDPTGNIGRKFREAMHLKIEKWQEPPPAKIAKPLPVPDGAKKKRRGGRRLRKYKERYGMTNTGKATNRIGFNQQEEEVLEDDELKGLGMLGTVRSSHFCTIVGKRGGRLNKSSEKKAHRFIPSKVVSGVSSSLTLTPAQGIELSNPLKAKSEDATSGTRSYFSDTIGFKSTKIP